MTARTPEDVDRLFAEALNAGNLDALVVLYEPDASLTPSPGTRVTGAKAIREALAGFVADGGTLLVIARGREPSDDPGAMPWPLTRDDLTRFNRLGLETIAFEDFLDPHEPDVRRFRVEFRRQA